MKYLGVVLFTVLFGQLVFAQNAEQPTDKKSTEEKAELPGLKNMTNVIVVGQLDKLEDRYSIEINLNQLFVNYKLKSNSSLNIIKQGGDVAALAADTTQAKLKAKGFDTYMLISVRGYDKRFRKTTNIDDMKTELESGHLFQLYREEIVSVTFEVFIYQNGVPVENRLIKVGSVGSRATVLRKLMKKMDKILRKEWLPQA